MLDLGALRIGVQVDGADKAKSQLSGIGKSVEETGKTATGVKGKLGGMVSSLKKVAGAAAVAFAVKKVFDFGKACTQAYSDYQQMTGGIEKLFGASSDIVMKNAENAYKTAGVSANKYMEQATSFSASLIHACSGNTEQAANVADLAIRDMSDNVNVFGTDMQSIQYAYQGFAKQNYTMLDNLKLGYGGTKQEMERLLADAGKLTGKKYDITNLKDVYEAIHAIQKEQKITGTTAKEASKTVEGSVNQMKASWTNFMTHIGSGKGVAKATGNLIKSVATVGKNLIPVIGNIVKSIGIALVKALPSVLSTIGDAMSKLADKIFSFLEGDNTKSNKAASEMMDKFAKGIIKAIPKVLLGIVKLAGALYLLLVQMGIKLVEYGFKAIVGFGKGITKGLPHPIKAIKSLLSNIKKKVTSFSLSDAAKKIIDSIKDGFVAKWHSITGWIGDKVTWIKNKFKGINLYEIGKSILKSLWDGLMSKWTGLKTWVADKVQWIKDAFTGAKNSGDSGDGKGHGHRNGLSRVPYDDYPALLHRGERVLTRAEAQRYNDNNGKANTGNTVVSVNFDGNYKFNNKEDIDYLMDEACRRMRREMAAV